MTTENIQAACVELADRLLCPEQFGYAVTAEVRDAARVALGRTPVEQSLYLNGTAALNERAEFEYSERASDLTRDEADSGTYHNPWVQSAWEGWQARALLSVAPADHVRGVTKMVVEAKPVAAAAYLITSKSIRYWSAVRELRTAENIQEDHREAGIVDTIITPLAAAPQQPAPTITCQLYGHQVQGCLECNNNGPQQPAPAWLPIESAPKGQKLIAGYFNKLGNWRTIIARYYLPGTLAASEDADEDQCDEEGYAKEGWYEESETHEYIMPTDEAPTHYMFLTPPPINAAIALQAGEQS